MSNIAILGHATRGREVIELLEMLGGINKYKITAIRETYVYFVDEDKIIRLLKIKQLLPEEFIVFYLEEFLKKFPYKVGDKVKDARIEDYIGTIIKAQWDDYEEEVVYTVIWDDMHELSYFAKDLQPYKKETMEEEIEYSEMRMPLDDDDKLAAEATVAGHKILPPYGYLIGKITYVDNGFLVEFVEDKPKYPKTYEECCEVLDYEPEEDTVRGYNSDLIEDFQKLKLCRDAYWKLVGWKPNWNNDERFKYVLVCRRNNIITDTYTASNSILAFPTEEMRDAFYDNFKDLIENCRELL